MITYNLETEEITCDHAQAYLEPPCCTRPGSSGYIECACRGMTSVVCDEIGCPGISEDDIERLLLELN